ncbi:hypothetical protein [Pseudomonas fluorescens]|uniref:Lipoprotein n=1 Tax=Pseudomonas fluorescens TaxID=294 RepID=A0A5E7QAT9_PSEFL|nr:hypothetical protein [Pseudomonas fluorescens]VVP57927.1 hypothetical protein PS880_05862 [Pseudomonas fluorescens]
MIVIRYSTMALLFSCHLAQACSMYSDERKYPLFQGKLEYQRISRQNSASTLINKINNVDIAHFHPVTPHSLPQSESNSPWNVGDYFQGPSYYTDNKSVFYEGKKLENPKGTPTVHAASFLQLLARRFAIDNTSI